MASSKCAICGSKKSRFINEQEASEFFNTLKFLPLGFVYSLINQ